MNVLIEIQDTPTGPKMKIMTDPPLFDPTSDEVVKSKAFALAQLVSYAAETAEKLAKQH